MSYTEIPVKIIGVLSGVLPHHLTQSDIDTVFSYAEASGDPPGLSKPKKVDEWLRETNRRHHEPLSVLGAILLEIECSIGTQKWSSYHEADDGDEWKRTLLSDVSDILQSKGLEYFGDGLVGDTSSIATRTLKQRVAANGSSAIEIEIGRALENVPEDPNKAVQFAGNVLEATFKHFLDTREIPYDEKSAQLKLLWKTVQDNLGIHPKGLPDGDLKQIADGLGKIVQGTSNIRNVASSAHGKSEVRHRSTKIRPRHARLVIHAAHTIALYVLECLEDH